MSNGGAVAAAAVAAKRKRILRAFRDGAACSPESARPLGELGLSRSMLLAGMIARGVVVESREERYYLDEAAEALDRRRRVTVIVWILVAVAALIAILSVVR